MNLEKMAKNLVLGPILAHLTQIRATTFFFSKKFGFVSHQILWSAVIMGKTNDTVLRKLQTDGRTDGQTDKSDFIEGCLTNVERPTNFFYSRTNNLNSLYTSVHLFPEKTSTKKTCAPLSNINKKYISALSKLIAFVGQVLILSEKMTRLPHSEQNMNFP